MKYYIVFYTYRKRSGIFRIKRTCYGSIGIDIKEDDMWAFHQWAKSRIEYYSKGINPVITNFIEVSDKTYCNW